MQQDILRTYLPSVLLLAAAAGVSGAAAPITLVRGGVSAHVIVLPAQHSASQAHAAAELRDTILAMTGAAVPIRTDAEPLPGAAILLGATRYTSAVAGREPDWEVLGDDGFLLLNAAPHVVIAGSPVRGSLYGVYELLETYCGCRWYTSWHSVIPHHETLVLPEFSVQQVPAFAMREPFWYDMFDGDFAARSRANGSRMGLGERHGGKIRFGGGLFVHTFNKLMPPAEFFATHPEYYSEIEGTRTAERSQLCLANPDVLRICTERVLARIQADPTAQLFSVSQNDWHGACTCQSCRALELQEGSPSGPLVHFVNQVAAEVEKTFPRVLIETLAYQYTRRPPRQVRPRANVVIRLCSIECDFSLPLPQSTFAQNRAFVEDMRGWSAITDQLYVWDYTTNFAHYLGPHPNFASLQGNVRFFRDNHVIGLFEQGAYQGYHAEFAELRAWILAKLLWDPEQDLERLYDDFFRGYYGPAAGVVRRYFDRLQALVTADEHVLRIWAPMTAPWYTDEFFASAADLWQQAEELVGADPVYRHHVRLGAMPVLYARLQRWDPAPVPRYRWRSEQLIPEGIPAAYSDLAADLLARLGEGRPVRLSESQERHDTFMAQLRGCTEGLAPVWLRQDGFQTAVVPSLGGRICFFGPQGGESLIDPDNGGMDVIAGSEPLLDENPAACRTSAVSGNSVTLSHTTRGGIETAVAVSLSNADLAVGISATNLRAANQALRPALRTALNLGPARALSWSTDGGRHWQTLSVPQSQPFATHTIPGDSLGDGTIQLASPVTGRSLVFSVAGTSLERIILFCAPGLGDWTRVVLLPTPVEAGAQQAVAWSLSLRAGEPVTGLPALAPLSVHGRDRLVVEDVLLPIGRPGQWGDRVSDPLAGDGSAIRLYGTHYEWCVQWRFDPTWFAPGVPYRLRARVRVAPSGAAGEAFWSGVYDWRGRRSLAQMSMDIRDAPHSYAWVEVATWIPAAGQYIWFGPGRFDRAAGNPSAVEAVCIDALELIRVVQP